MEHTIEIQLRPLRIDDTDFMVALASNPGATRYLPALITDRQMMESWISDLESTDHEFIVLLDDK